MRSIFNASDFLPLTCPSSHPLCQPQDPVWPPAPRIVDDQGYSVSFFPQIPEAQPLQAHEPLSLQTSFLSHSQRLTVATFPLLDKPVMESLQHQVS